MKIDIIEQKTLFDSFFKIESSRLRYEKFDGDLSEEVTYFCLQRNDAAAGVVYNTDTQKVLLIKQFRFPPHSKRDAWMIEVVAGLIDEGEDAETAAKREILEEIGYEVINIEEISAIFTSPGISSERIFLFYVEVNEAGKVEKGGGLLNEHEDIQTLEYTLPELNKLLETNEIQDAKTIIACHYLLNKHNYHHKVH